MFMNIRKWFVKQNWYRILASSVIEVILLIGYSYLLHRVWPLFHWYFMPIIFILVMLQRLHERINRDW